MKLFILKNFMHGGEISKIKIDDNNFIPIYCKWLDAVKPTIDINWDAAKKLMIGRMRTMLSGQWAIYECPPEWKYRDYIVKRCDLLVPPDVRERKGAFYTPPQWVAKAHEYLQKTFGESWQDEYYLWDNSAGSGNLLAGLKNKDNVWASTLDRQDVAVMHSRIDSGEVNLWAENVFQFDFLNDGFELKESAECIYTQNFESPLAALKTLGNMGVTGVSKKPLNREEAKKLKESLGTNFTWELLAMIFKINV